MSEPEHLISLKMNDGSQIDFSRTEKKEVLVERNGQCIKLPKATGRTTLDLVALLESFGKIAEEDE